MTVTGGSALAKEDIDRMVKDAEKFAEEDRKRRETVEMRNDADALAFRTEKLLGEHAETLTDEQKKPVADALATLQAALKGTNNDDEVRTAMNDLNEKASAMGQAVYAAAQAQQAAGGAPAEGSSQPADDEVVDAEIVDDDNDKRN